MIDRLRKAAAVLFALVLLAGFAVEFRGGQYGIPTWNELYALFGLPAAAPAPDLLAAAEVSVTFLDVGQGDAVLIAQDGEYCLIDAGPAETADDLAILLTRMGVAELRLLVLTHPHADHAGGMARVLESCTVRELLLPPDDADTGTLRQLHTLAEERRTAVCTAETGQTRTIGQGVLTVLQADFVADEGNENSRENNASLCLRYTAGDFVFLDTGDAEAPAEQALLDTYGSGLRATLFKAGHHGSSTSNSEAFLRSIAPQAVAISCGAGNEYGHPHIEVLDRLDALAIPYVRTDRQGTLTFLWQSGLLQQYATGKAA